MQRKTHCRGRRAARSDLWSKRQKGSVRPACLEEYFEREKMIKGFLFERGLVDGRDSFPGPAHHPRPVSAELGRPAWFSFEIDRRGKGVRGGERTAEAHWAGRRNGKPGVIRGCRATGPQKSSNVQAETNGPVKNESPGLWFRRCLESPLQDHVFWRGLGCKGKSGVSD